MLRLLQRKRSRIAVELLRVELRRTKKWEPHLRRTLTASLRALGEKV